MTAALEASNLGVGIVIVDDQPGLGGHSRFSADPVLTASDSEEEGLNGKAAFQVARELSQTIASRPGITVLSSSVAFGVYESNLVAVMQGINEVYGATAARSSSEAVAVVVECHGTGQRRAGCGGHHQVGGSHRVTRLQSRADRNSRDVRKQEQAVIESYPGNGLAAL